jgi:hypothetical protein
MLCPACKTELRVTASKYIKKGDKFYLVQELTCRNPKCENDRKVVDKIYHEISYESEE